MPMAKKRKLRSSNPEPTKPVEPQQQNHETVELDQQQPIPEPTLEDSNTMAIDEPKHEQEEEPQNAESEQEVEEELYRYGL